MKDEKIQLSGYERLLARVNEEVVWKEGKPFRTERIILREINAKTSESYSVLTPEDEQKIRWVLTTLSPREEKILKMRCGIETRGYTLKEVGEEFGLGLERARQVEAKALRKLRHPSRRSRLPISKKEDIERLLQALASREKEIEEVLQARGKLYEELEGIKEELRKLKGEPAGTPQLNRDMFRDLSVLVNTLDLSVRSSNCLRLAGIKTIGDLVQKTGHQLLRMRGFGRRSLAEIKEILAEKGLSLGMKI